MARASGNKRESSLRVIAGQWRGRRLPFLADGVRPTGDRVRETLFNWLAPDVPGANCLDMFAGTGALGIEALSRGATGVLFVERNRPVADRLKQNLRDLDCEAGKVMTADAAGLDYSTLGPFDVVFLDPPFDTEGANQQLADLCKLLESSGCLAPLAHIYIESPRQSDPPQLPANWTVRRDSTAGQVRFILAERDK